MPPKVVQMMIQQGESVMLQSDDVKVVGKLSAQEEQELYTKAKMDAKTVQRLKGESFENILETMYWSCGYYGNKPALEALFYMHPQLLSHIDHIPKSSDFPYTMLSWCAKDGHIEAARYLLELKANVNHQTDIGETPLHLNYQKPEMVQLLLEHQASVDIHDEDGNTVVNLAHRSAYCGRTVALLQAHMQTPSLPVTTSTEASSSSQAKNNSSPGLSSLDAELAHQRGQPPVLRKILGPERFEVADKIERLEGVINLYRDKLVLQSGRMPEAELKLMREKLELYKEMKRTLMRQFRVLQGMPASDDEGDC